MHHLHPRSRTTGTLFTATLAISFLVVGLPHILPCPVDRRQSADSVEVGPDGKRRRRRRRMDGEQGVVEEGKMAGGLDGSTDDSGRPARECPVPKPGGLVGQIMGFERQQQEKERSVQVVVEGMRGRRTRMEAEDAGTGDEAR